VNQLETYQHHMRILLLIYTAFFQSKADITNYLAY